MSSLFGGAMPEHEERIPPAFIAQYDSGECTDCGWDIESGDEIRADGDGGWECAHHREE